MTACVLLRLKGDESTYMVDVEAGSVSKVEAGTILPTNSTPVIQGVDVAIAAERREATATFPFFAD